MYHQIMASHIVVNPPRKAGAINSCPSALKIQGLTAVVPRLRFASEPPTGLVKR